MTENENETTTINKSSTEQEKEAEGGKETKEITKRGPFSMQGLYCCLFIDNT